GRRTRARSRVSRAPPARELRHRTRRAGRPARVPSKPEVAGRANPHADTDAGVHGCCEGRCDILPHCASPGAPATRSEAPRTPQETPVVIRPFLAPSLWVDRWP